jgi:hypothetical protein
VEGDLEEKEEQHPRLRNSLGSTRKGREEVAGGGGGRRRWKEEEEDGRGRKKNILSSRATVTSYGARGTGGGGRRRWKRLKG